MFEYSDREDCILRIQKAKADRAVALGDGTRLEPGDLIVKIHLWNEHMPAASRVHDVGWARLVSRRLAASLCELDRAVEERADLQDATAVVADMALGTEGRGGQIVRMAKRYGFENVEDSSGETRGSLHRFGENILMLLLVLASNPAAARLSVLRRSRRRVYLSREGLRRCRLRFAADSGGVG